MPLLRGFGYGRYELNDYFCCLKQEIFTNSECKSSFKVILKYECGCRRMEYAAGIRGVHAVPGGILLGQLFNFCAIYVVAARRRYVARGVGVRHFGTALP